MFPPFPQEKAKVECFKLMDLLDKGLFSSFLQNSPGQMFGVAVCQKRENFRWGDAIPYQSAKNKAISYQNAQNDDELIVLRTFSGQLAGGGRWIMEGFVPPCINVKKWNDEVEKSDPKIKALTAEIALLEKNGDEQKILSLKEERRLLSNESLRRIYGFYEFCCFDGHLETYETLAKNADIFSIPTGCGDCCAPKLLNYAYRNALQVISMAEFFYGNEPKSGKKRHKEFYPPCDEKCGIVLPKMLGLDILYRDDDIIVVNKPAGVLSAPGKGEEKFDCIPYRVRHLVPNCIETPCVHRLDMDTSGILVLGLTKEAHRNLSMQFENRTVKKRYRALLAGKLSDKRAEKAGTISFPMRTDIENRPYQIYDEKNGRLAVTDWKVLDEFRLESGEWRTLVEFCPKTGRTHQLRLHSAHEKGLGLPIVGDRLYGKNNGNETLCLEAFSLEFTHPTSGKRMMFEIDTRF